MTDPREFTADERAAYAEVDAALRSLPSQPAPAGLVQAALARVRGSARPPFRLGWLDLALAVFGALLAALTLTVWGILRQATIIDPRTLTLTTDQPFALLALSAIASGVLGVLAVVVLLGVVLFVQSRRGR